MKSTETVTVMPPDLYDSLMTEEDTPEPDDRLREAAARARDLIVKQ